MKHKILVAFLFVSALCAVKSMAQKSSGTSYTNAVGMRVEFGSEYGTFAGISGKHFFDTHNAGELHVVFGNNTTLIGAEYQYHGDIENAAGLKWYAGFGPGVAFSDGTTDVLIRPIIGLDYKINQVPLSFGFDWRPAFVVTHGSDFNAARFGLGIRYAF
ncbi:hypothetical protein [Foetidibacter luteolus]|uniref:hypothetical protein n=1 Tax=Foetidibacter luteolus TaxID=2608880 RepID=UPI00129B61DA|nr:hypothetical protein [Foetidibacter luteolus]